MITETCIGYGKTRNKCKNNISENSDYWCKDCDTDRRATITKQLIEIKESFKKEH